MTATLAMKRGVINACRLLGVSVASFDRAGHDEDQRRRTVAAKFRSFTMVPEAAYLDNLILASSVNTIPGDIVECGVWRGGMIAGIASVLGGGRKYWLFDSFEGLPPAQEIDGSAALAWQNDKHGQTYYDNCTAEEGFARQAMELSGARDFELVKGWFSDTVAHAAVTSIGLLRLDGDWYDSTMTCLEAFYPKVTDGGLVIIDDYYTWDGCSRAVHDFLSRHALADRIHQTHEGIAYIVKGREQVSPSSTPTRTATGTAPSTNPAGRANDDATLAASV